MRISVNGSLNLLATAAKVRNEANNVVHQAIQTVSDHARSVKQDCQELVAAGQNLGIQSKKLGRAVNDLNEALLGLTPTLTDLDRQLSHWQRANAVPLEKINDLLKKFNH